MRNQFRIIAGEWRSRRFTFPDIEGLRPSPDRVRETLFNWLTPVISGARCLDLYAGSGALGLEALSRGAAEVWFIDRERAVVEGIKTHLHRLGCERGHVVQSEVLAWLAHDARPFDVVFMDPPFATGAIAPALASLATDTWIRPGSLVYMEAELGLGVPALPPAWAMHRSGKAGRVRYHLARVSG